MSLKWMESFEVAQNTNEAQGKYAGGGCNAGGGGRTGNAGFVNGGFLSSKPIASGADAMFYSFAMMLSGTPGSDTRWFSVGETYNGAGDLAPVHVQIYVTATRQLKVTRGNNLATLVTCPTVLAVGSFYWVELKVKCHSTLGEIELRIDTIPQFAPMTGQNTRNGGAGLIHSFQINWPAGSWYIDDLCINDDQGTFNNGFPGPVAVAALNPALGNGANVNWTPSAGTDHGALVDEAAPNGDTDYVSSNTVGHIDTFKYPALTVPGLGVLGVMVSNFARKTDVGPRAINGAARVSGANYVSPVPAQSLLTTYIYHPSLFELDPSTGAPWASQAAVNAAEFGAQLVT